MAPIFFIFFTIRKENYYEHEHGFKDCRESNQDFGEH